MARKKNSPQKAALRELMGNYLKENNVKVKDGTDVNSIMRDMMSIIWKAPLIRNWMKNWDIPNMIIAVSLLLIFFFHVFNADCKIILHHSDHHFLVTCTLAFEMITFFSNSEV